MKKLLAIGVLAVASISVAQANGDVWDYYSDTSDNGAVRVGLAVDATEAVYVYIMKNMKGDVSFSLDMQNGFDKASDCNSSNCTVTITVAGKTPYKTRVKGAEGYYSSVGDQKQMFNLFARNKVVSLKMPMRVNGGAKTLSFIQKTTLDPKMFTPSSFVQ